MGDGVGLRDLKSGAIGAALTLVAVLLAYAGKTALTRGEHAPSKAGESGRAGRTDTTAAHPEANGGSDDPDPAMAANANLVDQVRTYKERLEAIGAQKVVVEKQLAQAQQALAIASRDGQVPRIKNEYDLSRDDWKKLAAEGTVKVQTPCDAEVTHNVTASALAEVGLPPSDAQPIHDALHDSSWHLWEIVRALCAQGLHGSLQLADDIGPEGCRGLIEHMGHRNGGDLAEQVRVVAEINAGIIPMPKDPGTLGVYSQLLLAQSQESQLILQQLSKSIGPDDAWTFVFGGAGCWERSTKSVGPRGANGAGAATTP
jgi:hypothetical protein